VFFGLSVKGALTKDMVASMADNPIIFAMANPDPEITPEEVAEVREDAIVATGRSDYPNQVNNVLGFPYIFRGALDVRATTINDEMKIAAPRRLPSWRARMCPTRSPQPIKGTGRASGRIHHPGAVRSAADLIDPGSCRQGGRG
jgi:malate dehydrogenase (oxaloacetate-decarboxylating)(NADP+)